MKKNGNFGHIFTWNLGKEGHFLYQFKKLFGHALKIRNLSPFNVKFCFERFAFHATLVICKNKEKHHWFEITSLKRKKKKEIWLKITQCQFRISYSLIGFNNKLTNN
jgi:hypothetical protein